MYTDKKNILQLAALLRSHHVRQMVLCPGSRDIPLVQTLANIPGFTCYPVTDERSAGFFAIGLSLQSGCPAAVVCTSGSALLNLHPAVAEAHYQQIPLVIISADRPAAWIGQMDGQTFPQPDVFRSLVRKSVSLPEVHTEEDEWHCNRLINEALLELNHHGRGPVHINVPISDPFFQHPVENLPEARVISRYQHISSSLIEELNHYRKRMVIVGQMPPGVQTLPSSSEAISSRFAWLTESIGNQAAPANAIRNFDVLLYASDEETLESLRPELLITFGGHIISKRLKKFLRKHPPRVHWHVSPDGTVVDLFCCLTAVIELEPSEFFRQLSEASIQQGNSFADTWAGHSQAIPQPHFAYSEMRAVGDVITRLPAPCSLHLANSSTVRYAQLFATPNGVKVFSNRGINGIEGSLSTAVGYASASSELNFILIGDLSFFYDSNALWNSNFGSNIRILLLNNGGGEIFQALPGLDLQENVRRFVVATHQTTARSLAEGYGFEYLSAFSGQELADAMSRFTQKESLPRPLLLEVFTNKDDDIKILKAYYHALKTH